MATENEKEVDEPNSEGKEKGKVWYLSIVLCGIEEERLRKFLEPLTDKYAVDKRLGLSFSWEIINYTIKNIPGRILFYFNGSEGPRFYLRMVPAFLSASQSCICFYNEEDEESIDYFEEFVRSISKKKGRKLVNDHYLPTNILFYFIGSNKFLEHNKDELDKKVTSIKEDLREIGFKILSRHDQQIEKVFTKKVLEEIINSIGPDVITSKLYSNN